MHVTADEFSRIWAGTDLSPKRQTHDEVIGAEKSLIANVTTVEPEIGPTEGTTPFIFDAALYRKVIELLTRSRPSSTTEICTVEFAIFPGTTQSRLFPPSCRAA